MTTWLSTNGTDTAKAVAGKSAEKAAILKSLLIGFMKISCAMILMLLKWN
ncbi:MAG: hypothetical protein IPP22_12665 [Nitrosomonas sp.]|nr:hypothetical protein [Nitrosomonas sp.]